MKKLLSLALCLCLLLALLPAAAMAYTAVLSPQNLTVDGRSITCEKYNIDGSNYFKLRDIAYLLMGSDSEFGVGWDPEANSVLIIPGMPYEPVGGELTVGEDKSATAVPSAQTVWCLDAPVSDMSVYNIGGNNFFKLRDLGTLLGFEVGYDADTNTAQVFTGAPIAAPVGAGPRAEAFDTLWDWVANNFNDATVDREYYDILDWDDGAAAMLELIDSEAGSIVLRLNYLYPTGDSDESLIYLERDSANCFASYYFYGGYGEDYTEPDFHGYLTMDPAAFAAGEPVEFDFVEGALTGLMDYDFWSWASESYAFSLSWLDDLIRNTPELANRISIIDFGFTWAAIESAPPDGPKPVPAGSEDQAAAYAAIYDWAKANLNDTVEGYAAYTKEELLVGAGAKVTLSVVPIDFLGEQLLELCYSYRYGTGDTDSAYLFLDTAEQTYYGGYEHYPSGATAPDFFGDFIVDAATFDGNHPLDFDEAEGEKVGTDFAVSARYLAVYSLCDMLLGFDELCRLTIAPDGAYDITDFGFETARLSTAELAIN